MKTNLSASLAKLKESSAKLNELTDKANDTVRAVERFLVEECKAGSFTAVPTSLKKDGHPLYLVYWKYGGKFRLSVARYEYERERYSDYTRWSNCDRDTKLVAIQFLPDLIDEIRKELERRISGAQEAIEKLHQALPPIASEED